MKKFKKIIFLSIVFYLLSAFVIGFFIKKIEAEPNYYYRVEANQILNKLKKEEYVNIEQYKTIDKVTFLEKKETDKELIDAFFKEIDIQSFIQPWYQDNELKGYIKFSYHMNSNTSLFWILEILLFVFFLVYLSILLYLNYQIIIPFHRLNQLPFDIAQKHYKKEIKVEKSKYFHRFLLGLSQLQDTLELSEKRRSELLKDKKQLLLSLSHDIKTPLNLIQLYASTIEESDKSNSHIKQIKEKVTEIEVYVNQITKSSRDEIIEFDVQIEEFYLKDLVDKISSIYIEQCQLRNINFIIKEYQNRIMKGDFNRCQEILENVIENAFKYSDGKELIISFEEEDYYELIHVYSSGNPVNENEIHHLFDSFFRGMNAKGKKGSGLGLYICQELLRKMNGNIYAKIEENGMIFTIVLPQYS